MTLSYRLVVIPDADYPWRGVPRDRRVPGGVLAVLAAAAALAGAVMTWRARLTVARRRRPRRRLRARLA